MKKILLLLGWCLSVLGIQAQKKTSGEENTLLWKISGNGLAKPSYLFGTMHMICASDIGVSPQLQDAIGQTESVYLEVDMDNMLAMLGAMNQMSMKGDTTLKQLLSAEDYAKVKAYFQEHSSMLPFNMLEKFKPMLVESMIMEQSESCSNIIVMEQEIMKEAKSQRKTIHGLETVKYQMSLFDSIPYQLQARQLVDAVGGAAEMGEKQLGEITSLYRQQKLDDLEKLTSSDAGGMQGFLDLLLYNRNANWAAKLKTMMADHPVTVAVGAGHLPGSKGLINLLRKAGYKVEPVKNDMVRTSLPPVREI